MIYSPDGLMRYNNGKAIVDDMPLLSQWIKKSKSEDLDFLCKDYKKDIFGIIEYEFELLHKSRRKPCISSIPQELHIIKTKFCISSLRKLDAPSVMRYNTAMTC